MNGLVDNARVHSRESHNGSASLTSSTRSKLGLEITHLLTAASHGDVEAIRGILGERVVGVNSADYDGRTALHLACSEGKVDAVRALLELGADANPKDRFGNTPLADAQSYGSAEIVRMLKEKGGMVSESFHMGRTKRPQIQLDEFEIDPADLDLSGSVSIGKGVFGDVRKAKWKGTPVAVKVFQSDLGANKKAEEEFREELRILQQLRHPNIVQFLGAVTRSKPHMLVTELLTKGNLYQVLRKKGPLATDEAMRYALDIARGMNYLHQHKPDPIVHRDLSPHNLLRDESGHLKVADFGLSRIHVEVRSFYVRDDSGHGGAMALLHLSGTQNSYRYIAPEAFVSEVAECAKSVDVFSFAIIIHEMFEGLQKAKYRPEDAVAHYAEDTSRPAFNSNRYPPGLQELIAECWDHDPLKRPTFDTILGRLEGMMVELQARGESDVKQKPKCCAIL